MSTIDVKVDDLIGAALDWAVAQVEGLQLTVFKDHNGMDYFCHDWMENDLPKWSPSTDWIQGGKLIEKYKVGVMPGGISDRTYMAMATGFELFQKLYGPTHLIAVCRAIVSAKLGDTVSVPAELVEVRHAE